MSQRCGPTLLDGGLARMLFCSGFPECDLDFVVKN